MSISTRGPKNILVLDKTGVQITEVCDFVAEHRDITKTISRFAITADDVFECIGTFVDVSKSSKKDKIDLMYIPAEDGEYDIETTAITDRIFFMVIDYAKAILPDHDSINDLFRYGLELIINDCMEDIKNNNRNFENSEIHEVVFKSFEKMSGEYKLTETEFKLSSELMQALKYGKN